MPKGDNKTTIDCTTELKLFMDARKGKLERSFHCVLTYLAHYKDEFIAEYGQKCYEEHVKRYSIPAIELRNRSYSRKKEANERKRRELDIREKELELKTKFLSAETQIMTDKHETKEQKKERKLMRSLAYIALLKEKEILGDRIRFWGNAKIPFGQFQTQEQLNTAIGEAKKQLAVKDAEIAKLKGEPVPAQPEQSNSESQQAPHP